MREENGRELDLDCKNVKLSIIIPVYNTQIYLEKCLESVINAVEGIEDKVEALIINDGSTDQSGEIIRRYCEKYSGWMRYYDKPNGGLSDVKNYGLERANGEYIIFLDSDDYIDSAMYKKMLKKAEEENADVVVCDIKLVYDNGADEQIWPCTVSAREDTFSQVIDMSMMPASWNKIVKRELYNGLSFPVGLNNEDVAVTPIVLARANKIAIVNDVYYNYYQRSGSIQNSSFSEKRFVILKTTKLCFERLEGIDALKIEKIKGSLYMHQVLSLAYYLIRVEKFARRYTLLKVYMSEIQEKFPDIWSNAEVREALTWEGRRMRMFRKGSYFLLKRKQYFMTCVFWSICNIGRGLYVKISGKSIQV